MLALLSIAVGCAAVVVLMNIGHNAQLETMSIFRGMGRDLLVASVQMLMGSQFDSRMTRIELTQSHCAERCMTSKQPQQWF